jgi:hypothetical protein
LGPIAKPATSKPAETLQRVPSTNPTSHTPTTTTDTATTIMAAPHYRKVELQSPADFTYLYANTVALSRQKLDLNLPPSATNDDQPDPMRERVRELVDEVGSIKHSPSTQY